MISCRDAAELIPLHVGDDLPGEDAVRIEEHLEHCALCNAEYASFASAREALASLREELPERGSLWAQVARSLGEDGNGAIAHAAFVGAGRPRRRPRWAAWTGLAAAAALAVAFLPGYFRPGTDAAGPGAGAELSASQSPMIERTSAEELRNFLLRSGVRLLPIQPGGVVGEEQLPLTTPASAQPGATLPPHLREPAKVY